MRRKDLSAIFDEIITNGDEIIKSGRAFYLCRSVNQSTGNESTLHHHNRTGAFRKAKTGIFLIKHLAMDYTFADVRGIMAGLAVEKRLKPDASSEIRCKSLK